MPSEYPMLNVTRRPYHLERRDLYNPLAALDVADMQGLIMQIGVDFALYGTPIPMFAWVSLHTESYGRQECKARSLSQLLLSSLQLPYELGTSVQDVMGLLVRLDIMGTVANNFNYLVSDAVVVWRAYILWSDSLVAKGILLSFLTGTLAIQSDVKLAFLLATNVVATVLVGVKFWYYRRDIKGALGLFTRKSQVEKVLVLLLESGITYCAIWIAYTIIWTDAEKLNISYYTSDTFGSAIHNIAGIYPTFVVLVAMQSNAAQELLGTQVSQAMRFADLPMMSVASESESRGASAMHDPSLRPEQTTEQSGYTSTDNSRPEAVGSVGRGSLGNARKSDEKDSGIALNQGSGVLMRNSRVNSRMYNEWTGDSTNLDASGASIDSHCGACNCGMPPEPLGIDFRAACSRHPAAFNGLRPRSLAIVIGLESGHALVPPEMTDEHRKTIITSQLRVIDTLSVMAQTILQCRFAAEYVPRAVQKWRDSAGVLCPAVMVLNEIKWSPTFVRFLFLEKNHDLLAMQLRRTLEAADEIDKMDEEDHARVMNFLATLILIHDRKGISRADVNALGLKLFHWSMTRYSPDIEKNPAERCLVLLTRPAAMAISYIPEMRKTFMEGIETCTGSTCLKTEAIGGGPLLCCPKCKSAMYCSNEHMQAHAPSHKYFCFDVDYL
ncbi:hypothetical protein EV122DRAFT_252081 [Schizophyllum commune]